MPQGISRIIAGTAAALLLVLSARVAAQENEGEIASEVTGEKKDVSASISEAEQQIDEIAGQLDGIGDRLDDVARGVSGSAGKAAQSRVDPNLKALFDHREKKIRELRGNVPEDSATGIIASIGFFAMIVLMVFFPLYLRGRRRSIDADLQRRAIEAGMQFIPEIPATPKLHNDRRTGILLVGVGAAAAAPLALIGQTQIAAFGLAPIILGVVYFCVGTFLPSTTANK